MEYRELHGAELIYRPAHWDRQTFESWSGHEIRSSVVRPASVVEPELTTEERRKATRRMAEWGRGR